MRVGLVGLSSPCGYLYDRSFSREQPWGWNPVLESPIGLATLFDEVWFLHRALCPLTMRSLSFVRFLDENSRYCGLVERRLEAQKSYSNKRIADSMRVLRPVNQRRMRSFGTIIRSATGTTPGRNAPIDNHSSGIQFGEQTATGNTWSDENLLLDLIVSQDLSEFSGKPVELITNAFTEACIIPKDRLPLEMATTHGIVVKRIPSIQTARGPVTVGLEGIRENRWLRDFRTKISSNVEIGEDQEIRDIVRGVEKEYSEYSKRILIEHQARAGLIRSTARNLLSAAAGKIIPPGVLEAADMIEASKTRKMNWTAFVASIEKQWPKN